MIRRAIHAALAAIGIALWVLLAIGACVLVALAVAGHLAWPGADRGNCWTYALPRWATQGGELRIRLVRVGVLRIPHVAWARPDGQVEQTEPVNRAKSALDAWFGAKVLYFRFKIRRG